MRTYGHKTITFIVIGLACVSGILAGISTGHRAPPVGAGREIAVNDSDNGSWVVLIPGERIALVLSDPSEWSGPEATGGGGSSPSIRQLDETTFVAESSNGSGNITYRKRHCGGSVSTCSFVIYYYLTLPNRPVFGLPNGARVIDR
jgi:hypothetical protein